MLKGNASSVTQGAKPSTATRRKSALSNQVPGRHPGEFLFLLCKKCEVRKSSCSSFEMSVPPIHMQKTMLFFWERLLSDVPLLEGSGCFLQHKVAASPVTPYPVVRLASESVW